MRFAIVQSKPVEVGGLLIFTKLVVNLADVLPRSGQIVLIIFL